MSTKVILQEIKRLPFNERLLVIEKAIKTLNKTSDSQLEKAAKVLSADYKRDRELTVFTVLDFEKFYETK